MKITILAAAAAVALAGSSMRAEACNPMLGKSYGQHVTPTALPASVLAKNHAGTQAKPTIVGLWHDVRTASDGTLFMEGYDTWHSDGTEIELANLPPATGNVCVGVFTRHGRNVDLTTHVAWLYDLNNNFVGTLNITQSAKVAADGNSYTGPFEAKFYDPSGNLFQDVVGTVVADRLTQ